MSQTAIKMVGQMESHDWKGNNKRGFFCQKCGRGPVYDIRKVMKDKFCGEAPPPPLSEDSEIS